MRAGICFRHNFKAPAGCICCVMSGMSASLCSSYLSFFVVSRQLQIAQASIDVQARSNFFSLFFSPQIKMTYVLSAVTLNMVTD